MCDSEQRQSALSALLREVDGLTVYRNQKAPQPLARGQQAAPHKPLLLLLAVRLLVVDNAARLSPHARYETPLRALLQTYNSGKTQHPEYPFVRLAKSRALWETTLPGEAAQLTPELSSAYLLENAIAGGFTLEAAEALRVDGAAPTFARAVLTRWFSHLGARDRFRLAVAVGLEELVLS